MNFFNVVAPLNDSHSVRAWQWIDQYSGKPYEISTDRPYCTQVAARVKIYGDVRREYGRTESKCADYKCAESASL